MRYIYMLTYIDAILHCIYVEPVVVSWFVVSRHVSRLLVYVHIVTNYLECHWSYIYTYTYTLYIIYYIKKEFNENPIAKYIGHLQCMYRGVVLTICYPFHEFTIKWGSQFFQSPIQGAGWNSQLQMIQALYGLVVSNKTDYNIITRHK